MSSILIVEDDPICLGYLSLLLGDEGHSVRTASSCEVALRHLEQEEQPDVLVADWHLPDGSGQDVIEAYRLQGGFRTVLMTGWPLDHVRRHLAPGTPLVPKPVDLQQMVGHIRALLG